jgi:hypothetical protein
MFVIEGFCKAELNPFGPVQAYVAPVTDDVERFKVLPEHKGEFDVTTGVAGIGYTVTGISTGALEQPFNVIVKL